MRRLSFSQAVISVVK